MQTFVNGDNVTSDFVRHWTGSVKQTLGLVRIDNASYAFLGAQELLPSLVQTSLIVHATRTVVTLELPKVLSLELTFLQTAFTDDVYRLSRPVYYVTIGVKSLDGWAHAVQIYLDASAEHTVNSCYDQAVKWSDWASHGLRGVQIGSAAQDVLGQQCDECNIDWGYLHLAANASSTATHLRAGSARTSRQHFLLFGSVPSTNDTRQPRMCMDDLPALALSHDMGVVSASYEAKLTALLGYDEVEAIYYFGEELKGLWRQNYTDMPSAMAHALAEEEAMLTKSVAHDAALYTAMCKAGGRVCDEYASLGALAYRQTLGALKVVWVSSRNDCARRTQAQPRLPCLRPASISHAARVRCC